MTRLWTPNRPSFAMAPFGALPAAGTATNATTGMQLKPGDATPWLHIGNLNKLFRICSGTADYLTYLALS